MPKPSRKRSYDNSRRREAAKRTREQILEAMVELLADPAAADFSVAAIAKRAGVSEPTVYRYFPNREALMEGFDKCWEKTAGSVAIPDDPDGLAEAPPVLFAYYDQHEAIIRAARTRAAANGLDVSGRGRRDARITHAFAPLVAHLAPADAKAVASLFRYLLNSLAWHTLTGELGVESAAAGRAVSWATKALIAELRREQARGCGNWREQ